MEQWQARPAAYRSLLDTREGREAAKEFTMKSGAFWDRSVRVHLRVVGDGHPDLRGDDLMWIKAGADLENLPEAAEEKAGADQEDQRKGDLGDDQRARDTRMALARAGTAAALPEARDLIGTCSLESGGK